MSEVLRQSTNVLRFGLVAALGALLALALREVWELDTRWLVVTIVGIGGVALSMCMISVFSDFALIVFMFFMPLMSFQKWFWPDRYTAEDRGNLVYSGVLGVGLLDFFLLGVYLSWFYRIFVARQEPLPQFNGMDAAVAWLVVAHLAASIGSSAPDLALGADVYLLRYALLYFYLSRNLSAWFLPWMLAAFSLTILFEAGLGGIQTSTGKWLGIALDKGAGGSDLDYQYSVPGLEGIYRATGTCYDSHSLGHFVALMLPFPLVLCLTPTLRWPLRLFCGGIAALAAITVLLSFSRSAWLAVAIALAFGAIVVIGVWQERQVIPTLATGLVLIALMTPVLGGYVYDRFASAPDETLTVRYDQYWVALWIIYHYPFFGNGPGNWFESLQKFDYLWLEDLLPVHNVLLWLTADTGIIGVSGYLAMFVVAAVRLFPVVRKRRDIPARLALATCLALMITLLNGLTDPTFREPNVFSMFWLLISLAVVVPALPRNAGEEYLDRLPAPNPPSSGTEPSGRMDAFVSSRTL